MHPHESRYIREQLQVLKEGVPGDKNKATEALIRYLRVTVADKPNPRSLAKLQADVLESARRAAGAGEVVEEGS